MHAAYTESKTFEKADFTAKPLPTGDYEDCHFTACNFSGTDLSACNFIDCTFTDCNLSLAKLVKTGLKGVRFSGCKAVGLHFDDCNTFNFDVSFAACNLDMASFYNRLLKKTVFAQTTLREADFSGADLTGAVFDACDLSSAIFDNTNLHQVDFRTAQHFNIDPTRNRIKGAKFALTGLPGLLQQYGIHIS